MALTPRLTSFDQRVLAALPEADTRGVRATEVAEQTYGWPGWTCDGCGHVQRRGSGRRKGMGVLSCGRRLPGDDGWCEGKWRPGMLLTAAEAREVFEVLHGLERTGHARHVGGWWRRAT